MFGLITLPALKDVEFAGSLLAAAASVLAVIYLAGVSFGGIA
jgi:hypothetical protein